MRSTKAIDPRPTQLMHDLSTLATPDERDRAFVSRLRTQLMRSAGAHHSAPIFGNQLRVHLHWPRQRTRRFTAVSLAACAALIGLGMSGTALSPRVTTPAPVSAQTLLHRSEIRLASANTALHQQFTVAYGSRFDSRVAWATIPSMQVNWATQEEVPLSEVPDGTFALHAPTSAQQVILASG